MQNGSWPITLSSGPTQAAYLRPGSYFSNKKEYTCGEIISLTALRVPGEQGIVKRPKFSSSNTLPVSSNSFKVPPDLSASLENGSGRGFANSEDFCDIPDTFFGVLFLIIEKFHLFFQCQCFPVQLSAEDVLR